MKTPTEIINQITCNGMRELTEARAIEAILAYHDQFVVTPSERERQIAEKVIRFYQTYKPFGTIKEIAELFTYHELYRSIPPARSVEVNKTMPSREDAEKYSKDICENDTDSEGSPIGGYTMGAMMDMYNWISIKIKSTENKEA